MISDNYRTSPIWNQARHLVLALSVAADSFGSPAADLSKRIHKDTVQLLLGIMDLHEARVDRHTVDQSIANLELILIESQKKGFLRKSAFTVLRREIRELRSALKQLSLSSGSASAAPPIHKKLSLSPFTGALS